MSEYLGYTLFATEPAILDTACSKLYMFKFKKYGKELECPNTYGKYGISLAVPLSFVFIRIMFCDAVSFNSNLIRCLGRAVFCNFGISCAYVYSYANFLRVSTQALGQTSWIHHVGYTD